MAMALPSSALASGASTSVTLSAGSLGFSTTPSASNFASTALTGSQQTIQDEGDHQDASHARPVPDRKIRPLKQSWGHNIRNGLYHPGSRQKP